MRWWVWAGLGIAACGIILLLVQWHELIFLDLIAKTEIMKHWVTELGVWGPLAYLAGYVLRPLVFFPSTPYAILGGVLFGSVWGTVYVLIGAMCSGVCEFLLVRYFIGEKAKKFLREKTRIISEVVVKHGFTTVFLVRLIPNVAFDLQNCGLAFAPIKFTHYFYGTLLGCLPASIFYASLGSITFDWSSIWKIGVIVSLGVCWYLLYRLLPAATKNE
jgi:uncharacterized membrane protein YdjX (TVP38/TMEM64 family)